MRSRARRLPPRQTIGSPFRGRIATEDPATTSPRPAAKRGFATMPIVKHAEAATGTRIRVSMGAIVYYANRIRAISDARARTLSIQTASRGWREREPVGVTPEKPMLLR